MRGEHAQRVERGSVVDLVPLRCRKQAQVLARCVNEAARKRPRFLKASNTGPVCALNGVVNISFIRGSACCVEPLFPRSNGNGMRGTLQLQVVSFATPQPDEPET